MLIEKLHNYEYNKVGLFGKKEKERNSSLNCQKVKPKTILDGEKNKKNEFYYIEKRNEMYKIISKMALDHNILTTPSFLHITLLVSMYSCI